MKLKLLVVSMGVLGFISNAAFAAPAGSTPETTSPNGHPPVRHHAMPKHHAIKHVNHDPIVESGVTEGGSPDYKNEMGPMPDVCGVNYNNLILDEMTQNTNRAIPNPCDPGWFERIHLSGGINIDMGKWGNRDANIMGENYQRVSLNDAYLNVFALVNEWATAFASISFNTATINDGVVNALTGFPNVAEYSAAYSNNIVAGYNSTLQLEQAYATFGNFAVSPFFVQIGKQFQDFGRYEIHPITRSMTQVMSETLATSAKVGFIAGGFNGSLYIFDDQLKKGDRNSLVDLSFHRNFSTNYGAAIGYDQTCEYFGWDIGAAYLYNLLGVNDVAYNMSQFRVLNFFDPGTYDRRVSGAAVYADINSGPFTLNLRYTTALQRFNAFDLPQNGFFTTDIKGAKPWSYAIQASYDFTGWCCTNQSVFVNYQTSRQASGLSLPRKRFAVGYNVEMMRNTNVGIEWDHDIAYIERHGGSGEVTNLVSIRASVQFG